MAFDAATAPWSRHVEAGREEQTRGQAPEIAPAEQSHDREAPEPERDAPTIGFDL